MDIKNAQEVVDLIEREIRGWLNAGHKVGVDPKQRIEALEMIKRQFLFKYGYEQCYSCDCLFAKDYTNPDKFCSNECRYREHLEAA